jgi:hypothetical protein
MMTRKRISDRLECEFTEDYFSPVASGNRTAVIFYQEGRAVFSLTEAEHHAMGVLHIDVLINDWSADQVEKLNK